MTNKCSEFTPLQPHKGFEEAHMTHKCPELTPLEPHKGFEEPKITPKCPELTPLEPQKGFEGLKGPAADEQPAEPSRWEGVGGG